jgi:hypothetical protein
MDHHSDVRIQFTWIRVARFSATFCRKPALHNSIYWHDRGRIVVLWFYWSLASLNIPGKVMVVGEAAIAAFLVIWLNTAQARSFFKTSGL